MPDGHFPAAAATSGAFEAWARRGFGPHLIPIIPPLVRMSPNSTVPLDQRGKVPGMLGPNGWHSYDWRGAPPPEAADLKRWGDMGASIGLRLGALLAVDGDVTDGPAAKLLQHAAELTLGETALRVGRAPKWLLLYRAAKALRKRKLVFTLPGSDTKHAVELLADGQQIAADGVHPGTGRPYEWPYGRLSWAELPVVDEALIEALWRNLLLAMDMLGGEVVQNAAGPDSDRAEVDQASLAAPSPELLAEALSFVKPDGSREDFIRLGIAIKAAGGTVEQWEEVANRWDGDPEDPADLARRWEGFRAPFSVGWSHIEMRARGAGWTGSAKLDFAAFARPSIGHNGGPPLDAEDDEVAHAADGRVLVHLRPAEMHRDADRVMRAMLADSGRGPLFNFGGHLCAVRRGLPRSVREKAGAVSRPRPTVKDLSLHALRERMAASCAFQSTERGKLRPVAAPLDLAHMILAREGEGAPVLLGIGTAPVLRPDGTVLAVEGYDAGTGLLIDFGGVRFPPVPKQPTQEDAAAALYRIKTEAFEGFPFASDADADAATAAFLTALALHAVEAAPMFIFAAPAQGTGKTALAGLVAHLAFGAPPGPLGWPSQEEEREKALLAVLREGAQVVFFDNMKDGAALDSPALARAVTGAAFKARVLGVSEAAEVPSNVLWLATGNNISAAGDMPSRTFTAYLDPKAERPDTRRHRRPDLAEWADRHRAEMVTCGLTVLRAYAAAGHPEAIALPSRFPGWDRTVRAALAWAAGTDRLAEKLRVAGEDDPVQATRLRLVDAWQAVFGGAEVSAGDVLRASEGVAADFGAPAAPGEPAPAASLRSALAELGHWSHAPTRERVAAVLRKLMNRVIGGRSLIARFDSNAKALRYRLEVVGSELTA